MWQGSRGFTLIEALVTLAVVSIVLTIAIPQVNSSILERQRRGALQTTAGLLESLPAVARARQDQLVVRGVNTSDALEIRVFSTREGDYLPPPLQVRIPRRLNPQTTGDPIATVDPTGVVTGSNPVRIGTTTVSLSRWGQITTTP